MMLGIRRSVGTRADLEKMIQGPQDDLPGTDRRARGVQATAIYPQPIGHVGLSRVDVRDIAEAAAISLTSSGHEGETYDLVGPELQTGESTAKVWSEPLKRPIKPPDISVERRVGWCRW
jgi:uncharacterized protein YbjT (DUF2867 family)